jgi:hypothetical protein
VAHVAACWSSVASGRWRQLEVSSAQLIAQALDFMEERPLRLWPRHVATASSSAGITCPKVEAVLLTVYFDFFVRAGFLPPMPGAERGAPASTPPEV